MSATESMYRLRWPDGQSFGPAPLETIRAWAREGRVPAGAMLDPVDGGTPIAANFDLEMARVLGAPPTVWTGVGPGTAPAADVTSTIIPYRNPPALIGYYLAVFSLIPIIAVPLGLAAIICGVYGLKRAKAHPEQKGKAHAWVAIILGAITMLLNLAVVAAVVLAR